MQPCLAICVPATSYESATNRRWEVPWLILRYRFAYIMRTYIIPPFYTFFLSSHCLFVCFCSFSNATMHSEHQTHSLAHTIGILNGQQRIWGYVDFTLLCSVDRFIRFVFLFFLLHNELCVPMALMATIQETCPLVSILNTRNIVSD